MQLLDDIALSLVSEPAPVLHASRDQVFTHPIVTARDGIIHSSMLLYESYDNIMPLAKGLGAWASSTPSAGNMCACNQYCDNARCGCKLRGALCTMACGCRDERCKNRQEAAADEGEEDEIDDNHWKNQIN